MCITNHWYSENLSESSYDLAVSVLVNIACVNIFVHLLPSRQSSIAQWTWRVSGTACIVLLACACIVHPFSPDRPHKLRFSEVWEVSGGDNHTDIPAASQGSSVRLTSLSTMRAERVDGILQKAGWTGGRTGRCEEATCSYTGLRAPTAITNTSSSMEINIGKRGPGFVAGNITGSIGSRVCSLRVDGYTAGTGGRKDKQFGVWLDDQRAYRWRTLPHGRPPNPFKHRETGEDDGVKSWKPAYLLKRGFDEGRTISSTFLVQYEQKRLDRVKGPVELVLDCHHGESVVSNEYAAFTRLAPEWMSVAHGRFGGTVLRKRVSLI